MMSRKGSYLIVGLGFVVGAGIVLTTNPKLREQLLSEVELWASNLAGTAAGYRSRLQQAIEEGRLAAADRERDLTSKLSTEPTSSKADQGPDYVV